MMVKEVSVAQLQRYYFLLLFILSLLVCPMVAWQYSAVLLHHLTVSEEKTKLFHWIAAAAIEPANLRNESLCPNRTMYRPYTVHSTVR